MSIALTAKVEALESTLIETRNRLIDTNTALLATREQLTTALDRIAVLEQTCARKPGPKGNHNG